MTDTNDVVNAAIVDLEARKQVLDTKIPQLRKELKDSQAELEKINYVLSQLKMAKDFKPATAKEDK